VSVRVALGAVRRSDDKILRFAAQLGLQGVVLNTPLDIPGDRRWNTQDLIRARERVEAFGLHVEAIENTPLSFYLDTITGGPARDQQLDNYCQTVKSLGEAAIPILGFHWMANAVWRTDLRREGRGGAHVTAFDVSHIVDADAPTLGVRLSEGELWENFERFLDRVLPVAEEAGVRLALHPDDPPVPSLGGVARIFASLAGLRRALELAAGSAAFGLEFCVGTVSSMGPGAGEALKSFAANGDIAYVHLRDVRGHVPSFEECFLDEGNLDCVETLRGLVAAGFDGFLIDDHVPLFDDDPPIVPGWVKTEYAYHGHGYTVGYLQGILKVLQADLDTHAAMPHHTAERSSQA
jgi:mannonate dehydratase